jgi:hypothetical protein
MELKDHMTCYKCFVKKNSLQDLLCSLNAVISTNERNLILTGHVIFKLRYSQIFQMKTTLGKVKCLLKNGASKKTSSEKSYL